MQIARSFNNTTDPHDRHQIPSMVLDMTLIRGNEQRYAAAEHRPEAIATDRPDTYSDRSRIGGFTWSTTRPTSIGV